MYYVFVNPASGSGNGALLWNEAESLFLEKKMDFELHYTLKDESIKNEYEEILRKTSERPIKLIVLGGDGTLNQVINGIADPSEVELSLIRCGSGNDFTRNKTLPAELNDILDGIKARSHESLIDIGEIRYNDGVMPDGSPVVDGSHRFLVSCGLGYDADICYNANKSITLKKLLGHNIYTYFGVKNIFTTGLVDMEVTVDGEISYYPHVYFLSAMNQPYEGGGLAMVPSASDTDGILDCCIIYSLPRFSALMTIPKIQKGVHIGQRGVDVISGHTIHISCSQPKMVHYDGETPGMYKSVDVSIYGQIKFVY